MNEQLWQLFERMCLKECQPIQEFVRLLQAGEVCEFSKREIVDFLRWVETNMLWNIQMMAVESPANADVVEHVSEETQQIFEELLQECEER